MKSVVVIPCWRRPEFLAVTLKKISGAAGWGENKYLFQIDADYDPQIFDVIKDANSSDALGPFDFEIHCVSERVGTGNSHNILQGLKAGLDLAWRYDADIIHLIEEDIWVGRDYFNFHEKAHRQFNPWAVSACRNTSLRSEAPNDSSAVHLSNSYQSLGVSFPLSSIEEILVHDNPEYYNDPNDYCRSLFPCSRYGNLFMEQDGLIQRIIERNKYDIIYPNVPRAFHAGFYSPGYHREAAVPTGTLEEKIAALESMTEQEMNDAAVYKDIRFCSLEEHVVSNLYLIEIV